MMSKFHILVVILIYLSPFGNSLSIKASKTLQTFRLNVKYVSKGTDVCGKSVSLFEAVDFDSIVNEAVDKNLPEPFGLITWNSSYIAAEILEQLNTMKPNLFRGKTICDVGCGTGLVSVVALGLGAEVKALDHNDRCLDLTRKNCVENEKIAINHLTTSSFDICGSDPLPTADIVVMSDIMYYDRLAVACAHHAFEAVCQGADVLITDPGRSTSKSFLREANSLFSRKGGVQYSSIYSEPTINMPLRFLQLKDRPKSYYLWIRSSPSRIGID